ncbi:MAG TPA: glycoside hydrolase family 172 protein [Candidatus Bathyarchaeia archaeon]|nr:glycoside hydrolase family 172 protein [Candidatus Bathyarchaeia archaeon]
MRVHVKLHHVWLALALFVVGSGASALDDAVHSPFLLDAGVRSRSISFENPTGAPGSGGQAASRLGPTRKGAPAREIKAGETVELANIEGPGTIRHIWMTLGNRDPETFRSFVIRAWWDDQPHPSIECPLGDFFGFAHGRVQSYQSAVHSVGEKAGMNIWLPMPFLNRARLTLTNEAAKGIVLYYQVDYTIGDAHPADVGRLHVRFARQNPTVEKQDFELLPPRQGKGRFIGALVGVRALTKDWWGEGEIKVYMDGDKEFPTICGTGTEDWACLSYGLQQTPFMYHGANLAKDEWNTFYRWHLPDPIYWRESCRITIQQIAWRDGLAETHDDWSAATFWYEPIPSGPLPEMPNLKTRTADIWPK